MPHIRINDATKGTFRLPEAIDNKNGQLKIGIRGINYWVGLFNIKVRQRCRWQRSDQDFRDFYIDPGLYNFKELVKDLKKGVRDLNIVLDKTTGLAKFIIPNGVALWISEPLKYCFGITDNNEWLTKTYTGNKPVEFLPTGGINIYLNELSTSNNFMSESNNINHSNLLENIPLLTENFAQHVVIRLTNPKFVNLSAGEINQLQFSFKSQWGNGKEEDLDNHSLPIGLDLEIK